MMFRKFSQWFDSPPHQNDEPTTKGARACEHPGCVDEGIYRAPKSRYHLESGANDWYWFCLIHIRDYNAKWNYYANMSEDEIERERRGDVTWQRPTWPLGGNPGPDRNPNVFTNPSFQDPLGIFNDSTSSYQDKFSTQSPEAKALEFLGITHPFTHAELRKRYLILVKQHHPDANMGSSESVEFVKKINEAYELLKKWC
jgi:hypothetical protein